MKPEPNPPGPRADERQRRVYFDSIGCRLNQSEIEAIARQFQQAGHALAAEPGGADLMVLNTCTVTAGADSESRSRIRRAHRANPDLEIAVTGCWATLNPGEAGELPGVSHVVPNRDKERLAHQLGAAPPPNFDREPIERQPLPGIRRRTRAYIKAQDGCNHSCAFCLTTLARGTARSLPVARVVRQAKAAEQGGAKEAVLSGVQLSSYGRDRGDEVDLATLVEALLVETSLPRLRLSSLEPWGLPDGFFDLWQDRRLCRQLHLPLQSGCRHTLRRMARPSTPASFAQLVRAAREAIPGVAITTDIVVGFPGESEQEFEESLAFIDEMSFADAHIFPFSARPGTPAAELPDRVPSRVAKARAERVRQRVQRSANEFAAEFLGENLQVLWEAASGLGPAGWELSGWSDNYLRVHVTAQEELWNQISQVHLESLRPDGLQGILLADERPST